LETIVIDDVFKLLQCDHHGLSSEEANRRLELFGPNKLESEEQNAFLQVRMPQKPLWTCSQYLLAVFEFHVESVVLGNGSSCSCRDSAF
jgi:magnesium-transporting ATPase (P-type)